MYFNSRTSLRKISLVVKIQSSSVLISHTTLGSFTLADSVHPLPLRCRCASQKGCPGKGGSLCSGLPGGRKATAASSSETVNMERFFWHIHLKNKNRSFGFWRYFKWQKKKKKNNNKNNKPPHLNQVPIWLTFYYTCNPRHLTLIWYLSHRNEYQDDYICTVPTAMERR